MTRRNRSLTLCCLVLAALGVGLLLAEGLVRVFYPHTRDRIAPYGLMAIDRDLGWKLEAGKNVNHKTRSFDVRYATNRLGFRDRDRRINDKKARRILLYGDSEIFGWGIPEEKRFSNLTEAQRPGLEIWNLAVPGYGLDQQILRYRRDGASLNADEVIFFVSRVTLWRIQTGYAYDKDKPRFEIERDGNLRLVSIPATKEAAKSLFYEVLTPLYLPYFVDQRLKVLKEALSRVSLPQPQPGNSPTMKSGSPLDDLAKKLLILARNTAAIRKHKMRVLAQLPETARKELRDFCALNGIDLLEIVFDSREKENLVFKYDPHWNIRANEVIAAQLILQLEREGR